MSAPSANNGHDHIQHAGSTHRDCYSYKEDLAPGLKFELQLKKIHTSTNSEFQEIDVIETCFGKTLVTDGLTQSSEFDEFVYHESLVHPALIQFASSQGGGGKGPETVFIGGGGELATAREVLRHKSIKRVVMVDLDAKVIEVSKQYLPEWGGEAVINDPRFELVISDAHEYVVNTDETFDVIIMDISDPVEAGPGVALYTKEFYELAITKLSPGGIFVTQAGMASAVPFTGSSVDAEEPMCFGPILNTLAAVFDVSMGYTVCIPSYGCDWGFVMAFNITSDNENAVEVASQWLSPPLGKIDALLDQQIADGGVDAMKFYDGESHKRMFCLTKPLRKYLALEKRIMTKENPIYMYG